MQPFPLEPVEWTGVAPDLNPEDTNYQWPPVVVKDRLERLKLYHDLFRQATSARSLKT